MQQVSEDVRISAGSAEPTRRTDVDGYVRRRRSLDPADEWLKQRAKLDGMTLAQLQRDAGILTKHQLEAIGQHETQLRDDDAIEED